LGQYPDAERLLVHSYDILSKELGALPTYRLLARHYLEDLYLTWGRPLDAQHYAFIKTRVVQNETLSTAPPETGSLPR
jgi:hypothetical protein